MSNWHLFCLLQSLKAIQLTVNWLYNGVRAVFTNQSICDLLRLAIRMIQALRLHRDGTYHSLAAPKLHECIRVF